ncbi:MAG TPA: Rrf2 family transcriptional regulator [Candidatus Faecalibacterium faecipullorum]|uniref:Rrf2 family transcriptional regulator n=1 Tax=Candidatus Faecalibacterium faecipullorum TaxID=2838578 RepID=A0A9D2MEM0_9FIRM|nr:Rrf2 family transcriptional regulator [Candidatus Faecalibacterium faecipullorum]
MIVSTKGRYALRVMIDLAERRTDRYTPLKEIAARQGISEKYLENILKTLVQHGLLQGLRGKGGGYRLTRPAGQYRISDILLLTEGSLAPVACLEPGAAACARAADCRTYGLWRGLDEAIRSYLDRVTLADLARPDQAGDSYVI